MYKKIKTNYIAVNLFTQYHKSKYILSEQITY